MSARGRGSGRGWYYKEKYGGGGRGGGGSGGGGRGRGNFPAEALHNQSLDNTSASPTLTQSANVGSHLATLLAGMDRESYGRLKSLKGSYAVNGMTIYIDHVQSDPFAPPSKLRIRVPQAMAKFPTALFSSKIRKVALEDYITREFWKDVHGNKLDVANKGQGWHGSKGADINIDKPGQQVLERSSMEVTKDFVEARFTLAFPAQGRSILGHQAATLLTEAVPNVAKRTMFYESLNQSQVSEFILSVEDQEELRSKLSPAGLVAFVANGAILPRISGDSDMPMLGNSVARFQSPPTLEVSFDLPNRGRIFGMGIRKGISLIVGGGFHGKSTLLEALQFGVYNHVPGDGREFVCTNEDVIKVRAEDGRNITCVNISPFISNLPFGKDTTAFSTRDASGSTSMAANIQEALELGCKGLLFDEDTCASNFLVRDRRMEMLIAKEKEPITPLISKIRALYHEQGCSSILVVGGCGSYLDVADCVVGMDCYRATNLTAQAKSIALAVPVTLSETNTDSSYGEISSRLFALPGDERSQSQDGMDQQGLDQTTTTTTTTRGTKSSARRTNIITFSGIDIDLAGLEQLVHPSQARCILDSLLTLRKQFGNQPVSVTQAVQHLQREWDEHGIAESVSQFEFPAGSYARPRGLELGGALNRLRGLRVRLLEK